MGPADEADLIVLKLRQVAAAFTDNPNRPQSQNEAGRLVMRASDLGLLPDVDGLPELVAWAKSDEPPLGERQSQLAHCPANVFIRLAGYDQVIVEPTAEGLKTVRGDGGGILPTAFPETLPAYPPSAQMSERKRAEHYATVCELMARRIEKAASQPATTAAEGEPAGVVPQAVPDDTIFVAPKDIAIRFKVKQPSLEQRLRRWRIDNPNNPGFVANSDRKPRQPEFIYQIAAVRHIIDATPKA